MCIMCTDVVDNWQVYDAGAIYNLHAQRKQLKWLDNLKGFRDMNVEELPDIECDSMACDGGACTTLWVT